MAAGSQTSSDIKFSDSLEFVKVKNVPHIVQPLRYYTFSKITLRKRGSGGAAVVLNI